MMTRNAKFFVTGIMREKKNSPRPQKAEGCPRCDYLNMTPVLIIRVIGTVHFNTSPSIRST